MYATPMKLRLLYAVLTAALALFAGACGGGGGGGDTPTAPTAPTALSATAASTTQIDLAWSDQSSDESGFEVVRSTDTLFSNTVSTLVTANTVTFRDSGLTPSTTYYYHVRSYNGNGSSAYTNTANATTFTVSTIVGGGTGTGAGGNSGSTDSTDGTGATARFNYPYGVTSDGVSLYVADTLNHTIRKVDMTSGAVVTLAGSPTVTGSSDSTDGTGATARFNYPYGIAWDGSNLFVADTLNHTIRTVDRVTGNVETVFGSAGVRGSANGTGAAASFNQPVGLASDGTDLYVADTLNHTIRKVVISSGAVTLLAGSAMVSGSTDSLGAAARFNQPAGIALDGSGGLYVADAQNHTIRKIVTATGLVTTVSGSAGVAGSANGTGTDARFNQPSGVTVSGPDLFVTDTMNHTIRRIEVSGATSTVTLLSGQAGTPGYVVGLAGLSRYNRPFGITLAGSTLYVADTYNHEIRSVSPLTGDSITLAGSGPSASASIFSQPHGITLDATNTVLYVANTYLHNIQKVHIASGATTTIAGSTTAGASDGTGAAASFKRPFDLTSDPTASYVYVADTDNHLIRQIEVSSGTVSTLAGAAGLCTGTYPTDPDCWADGTGTAALFNKPAGITTDGTSIFVSDAFNHVIRKIDIATLAVTTLAGSPGVSGTTDGTGAAARFYQPLGLAMDNTYLYVADTLNSTIRRVTIATGAVETIAGRAGYHHSADGIGTNASFNKPNALAKRGNMLYIADTNSHAIRKMNLGTGEVTTVAGTGLGGYIDGNGSSSLFNLPKGIATDGTNIYVSDTFNNAIRMIQ